MLLVRQIHIFNGAYFFQYESGSSAAGLVTVAGFNDGALAGTWTLSLGFAGIRKKIGNLTVPSSAPARILGIDLQEVLGYIRRQMKAGFVK